MLLPSREGDLGLVELLLGFFESRLSLLEFGLKLRIYGVFKSSLLCRESGGPHHAGGLASQGEG